jgi:HD superfamily phosphohydrolase
VDAPSSVSSSCIAIDTAPMVEKYLSKLKVRPTISRVVAMDTIYKIKNTVIRDNIEGNRLIETDRAIREIVDTPQFQRLRNIRQTGLSSFVFPSAEHSRFVHSLGVYATAMEIYEQLRRKSENLDLQLPGLKFDEATRIDFCIAALCHDLGHSAFSHVLETVLLPDGMKSHEECTLAILSSNSEIKTVIDRVADRRSVLNLLRNPATHPNLALRDLISSTFDVDRCDYVLRDSAMAGVEYGKYDLKWLIHAIGIETNPLGQPVLLLARIMRDACKNA